MALSTLRRASREAKTKLHRPQRRLRTREWRHRTVRALVTALTDKLGLQRGYTTRRKYERASWEAMKAFYASDREFAQYYRVSPALFDDLLQRLRPRIARNAAKQQNVSGSAFPPELMLAMTLRWLAGACNWCIWALLTVSCGRWHVAGHHMGIRCQPQACMLQEHVLQGCMGCH